MDSIYGIKAIVKPGKSNVLTEVYVTYPNFEKRVKQVQVAFFDAAGSVGVTWIGVKSLKGFEVVKVPKSIRESQDTLFSFYETASKAEFLRLDLEKAAGGKRAGL